MTGKRIIGCIICIFLVIILIICTYNSVIAARKSRNNYDLNSVSECTGTVSEVRKNFVSTKPLLSKYTLVVSFDNGDIIPINCGSIRPEQVVGDSVTMYTNADNTVYELTPEAVRDKDLKIGKFFLKPLIFVVLLFFASVFVLVSDD